MIGVDSSWRVVQHFKIKTFSIGQSCDAILDYGILVPRTIAYERLFFKAQLETIVISRMFWNPNKIATGWNSGTMFDFTCNF